MKIPQYPLDGLGGEYLKTQELEAKIADFLGVKHCIMVTSGTVAIFLALRAAGSKRVAVPALTMFGTATAAELAGCEIILVSNNEIPEGVDTYLHVSLNGRDCGIEEVVKAHPGLTVIEDACQAFGSMHNGKFLGTFGAMGCFSFSPHKILSAGNGGCVVTNDDALAREIRKLKNFGRETGGADTHDSIGYNFKFTDIQATFVLEQFAHLKERMEDKKRIYAAYYGVLQKYMRPHSDVPWFVDLYVENRDALMASLSDAGIGTRAMYPLINMQKPFASYPIYGDSTEDIYHAEHGLWLPSHFSLTNEDIADIASEIQARI